MGAAAAVLPIVEHNPSIFDRLEDSWCSECVLGAPWAITFLTTDENAAEDRHNSEDSQSTAASSSNRARSAECNVFVGPSDDPAGVGSGSGLRWCHSVDEKELQAIFRTLDNNADGFISKQELRRFTNVFGFEISDVDAESMIASVVGTGKCNDGISFKKFCRLYRTHLVGQEFSQEEEVEHVKEDNDNLAEVFKVFDKNGDGRISAEELKAVLKGLGLPEGRSLRQCTKMIQNVDCDGDGHCDIYEFKKMMASRSI